VHALAPTCEHCGVRIIGHGMEAEGAFYCCAHCARQCGLSELADRPVADAMVAAPDAP
jgi:hypothetical protein